MAMATLDILDDAFTMDAMWEDFNSNSSASVGQLSPSSSTSGLAGLMTPEPSSASMPAFTDSTVPDFMTSIKMEATEAETPDLLGDIGSLELFNSEDISAAAGDLVLKEEPFSFLNDQELQSMESGKSEEALKADLMWSSTTVHLEQKRRNRDISMTLSECAESLFDGVDLLGSSPPMVGVAPAQVNNQLVTSVMRDSVDDDENEQSDEEIDVVSDNASTTSTVSACSTGSNQSSSYSGRHAANTPQKYAGFRTSSTAARHYQSVQAGRSLLRNRQHMNNQQVNIPGKTRPSLVGQQPGNGFTEGRTVIDHMMGDHCYYQVRPPVSPNPLTPVETSEDDEDLLNGRTSLNGRGLKRKMEQGQTSAHNPRSRTSSTSENIKFKFRMNFHSNSPSGRQAGQNAVAAAAAAARNHLKRKSASRNAFCPAQSSDESSPSPTKKPHGNKKSKTASTSSGVATPVSVAPAASRPAKRSRTSPSADSSSESPEAKNREIRDLHNSMERQRRVDLRMNFDFLKVEVPELADLEKASKLTILNKASEYCRNLTARDLKLRRDRDRELQRNALLRKKLLALKQSISGHSIASSSTSPSSGVRLSSGRLSVLQRH